MDRLRKLKAFKALVQYSLVLFIGLVIFFVVRTGVLNPVFGLFQRVTVPLQQGFYQSVRSVSDTLQTIGEIGSLRGKNSKLRLENALLLAENARLKKFEAENKSLREQINTPLVGLKIKASAAPIGFSGLGTESVLLIDKGSDSRVNKGDFVIVRNTLLGRVVQVSSQVSSVRLLTDPNTKIPVKTDTGSEGLLEGEFGANLVLTNVSTDQVLRVGQLLLTSGKDSYPKDLVVGKITKVNRVEKNFFQQANVEQLLAVGSLTLVYIVSGT